MADLIVSPIVDRLLENLADYLKDQYELRTNVKGKLEKLKKSLIQIQAVARAADEVEIEKNEYLAAWLRDLKDAAYDAEDMLDEFDYQRLEQQVAAADEDDDGGKWKRAKVDDDGGKWKRAKFSDYFPPLDFFPTLKIFNRFTQSSDPLENLGSIQDRFEQLAAASGNFLELVKRASHDWEQRKKEDDNRRETTSFTPEPQFIGRTKELEQIIHLLLLAVDDGSASTSRGFGEVPVVPIVGPGGFGKTTLARHVFHDPRVEEHFQARLWVHVSLNFDVKRLTREMIESFASRRRCDDVQNLERLQRDLKEAVGSKRFLLVLDDMWWEEDSSKTEEGWRKLLAPLAAGARGSRVLLTSRSRQVARMPGALPPILLGGLVDDECWKIIKACAFSEDRDPAGYQNLVEIGKQIASNVKGSPLAANAVGGMLRNNRDDGYWSRILDTGLGEYTGMMDILNLSYHDLPPHLRKCFGYCSLFPKGQFFESADRDRLGCMWVAQGFIRPRPGETMEEAGRKCFNDLLSRSFFQIVHSENSEHYIMHDVMHDLAQIVSRGDCMRYEGGNLWEDNIPETVRHISVRPKHLAELSNRGSKFGNLRSFLIFPDCDGDERVDPSVIKEVLKQLRCVRVLSLDSIELPDDVSDWIHLRYLNLNHNRFKRLPESLCRLYHLQVLTVMGDDRIPDLPRRMKNLRNLQIFTYTR